jgi:GNAT superfamily N-acetyltransferase
VDVTQIGSPEKLSSEHDVSEFASGEPLLDDWLRRRALVNELSGASRTYVVCVGPRVVGYYTLSAGALTHAQAPGRTRRNMPDPIPVIVLGRLAVGKEAQGKGIGTGLLRDAVLRTLQAAGIAGIRAIMVHAISDDAKRFYEKYGFVESPIEPMTVMIAIAVLSPLSTPTRRAGSTAPRLRPRPTGTRPRPPRSTSSRRNGRTT